MNDLLNLAELDEAASSFGTPENNPAALVKSFSTLNRTWLADRPVNTAEVKRLTHILYHRFFTLLRVHLDARGQVIQILGSEALWQSQLQHLLSLAPYLRMPRKQGDEIDFEQLFIADMPKAYKALADKQLPMDSNSKSHFSVVGGSLYHGKSVVVPFLAKSDHERGQKAELYKSLLKAGAGFANITSVDIDDQQAQLTRGDLGLFACEPKQDTPGFMFEDLFGTFTELLEKTPDYEVHGLVVYVKVPLTAESLDEPLAPALHNRIEIVLGLCELFSSDYATLSHAFAIKQAAWTPEVVKPEEQVGYVNPQSVAPVAALPPKPALDSTVDAIVAPTSFKNAPKPFGEAPFVTNTASASGQGVLPTKEEALAAFQASQVNKPAQANQRPALGEGKPDTDPPIRITV